METLKCKTDHIVFTLRYCGLKFVIGHKKTTYFNYCQRHLSGSENVLKFVHKSIQHLSLNIY